MPIRPCLLWGVLWLALGLLVSAADQRTSDKQGPTDQDTQRTKGPAAKDTSPWHIVKVAKADAPRGGPTSDGKTAKSQKYLRVRLDFARQRMIRPSTSSALSMRRVTRLVTCGDGMSPNRWLSSKAIGRT